MTPPRTTSFQDEEVEIETVSPPPPPTAAKKSRMATIFVQDSSSSQGSTTGSSVFSSQSSVFAIDSPSSRSTMKVIHPLISSNPGNRRPPTIRSITTSSRISYSKSTVNRNELGLMPDVPAGLLDDMAALSVAENFISHRGGGDVVPGRTGRVFERRNINQLPVKSSSTTTRFKAIQVANTPTSTHPPFSIASFTSPHFPTSRPTIVYTSSPDEATELISCLRGGVYGFDLEWPVWKGTRGTSKNGKNKEWVNPGKTALVQICDEKMVLLLHVSKMDGECVEISGLRRGGDGEVDGSGWRYSVPDEAQGVL
jgi:hypothetical protein